MRLSRWVGWAGACAAAAIACSNAKKTVLQSRADECAPACDGGGELDAGGKTDAAAPELELGVCFGQSIDCERKVPIEPYAAGPSVACDPTDLGVVPVDWIVPLDDIDCVAPPCRVHPRIAIGSDGTLNLAGDVTSQDNRDSAMWFGSVSPGGELLRSDFDYRSVGSRLSMQAWLVPLASDDMGRWLAIERRLKTIREGDDEYAEEYDVDMLRYASPGAMPEVLQAVRGALFTIPFPTPDGGYVLHVRWDDGTYDPDDNDPPPRSDLSRYDATGKLLWNQTSVGQALALNQAYPLGFDEAGKFYLNVSRSSHLDGDSIQLVGGGYPSTSKERLLRIDPAGNVTTIRDSEDFPGFGGLGAVVTGDGALYGIRRRYEPQGDHYVELPPELERIDLDGTSAWVLPLEPDDDGGGPTVVLDDRDHPVVVNPNVLIGTMDVLHVDPTGAACERYTVPCRQQGAAFVCPEGSLGPLLQFTESHVYFAASSGGGFGAHLGRFTRPR